MNNARNAPFLPTCIRPTSVSTLRMIPRSAFINHGARFFSFLKSGISISLQGALPVAVGV